MRPLSRPLALLLPLLLTSAAFAAENKPATPEERAKKDLEYLAGKECEGRGLQTKGLLKAGEYIAEQFKAAGLKPGVGDSYFQPFDVPGPNKLDTPVSLVLKKGDTTTEPKAGVEFAATISSADGKKAGGLVFAGYGITSKSPKYDDYANLDVKGKIVVVMRRTPQADDPKGMFGAKSTHAPFVTKIQNALDHGAAGVLFVSDTGTAGDTDPLIPADGISKATVMTGPVMHVKRAVVDALLKDHKTTLAEWEAGVNKGGAPNSFALTGWQAETQVTLLKTKYPTRNVVGVLEGSGDLKGETVVIGGHYDHLGSGESGSFEGNAGKTHFGADDNASGTTGVLELARRFGAMKDRQGRRLVFVAFSGEEAGLFGSKHYAANPPFPMKDTAFMLNMDMIGRLTAIEDKDKEGKVTMKDRLMVYGTGTSTGLDKLVDATLAGGNYKVFKIEGGEGPSDHTSFYRKGVPVLFFFTGTHKDYHRPTDTPDAINVPGLLKVVDGVQVFAQHYATVKAKPDFLKTKGGAEDPSDPHSGGGDTRVAIPLLKFTPDYAESDKGVRVEAVAEGGPAAKGGMQAGDFIVSLGGSPVKNMTMYMTALGKVKAETEVEVVVLRGDKEVKLKVIPLAPPAPKK